MFSTNKKLNNSIRLQFIQDNNEKTGIHLNNKHQYQHRHQQQQKRLQRIPPLIFQTWHTKDLPPSMNAAVEKVKMHSKGMSHRLFDDEECRSFIRNNCSNDVFQAYESLIPGAYKADLWRYCILYKFGGIYMDIKYVPHNGFQLSALLDRERWVLDINKNDIYNALIIVRPNNPILKEAIATVVQNVKRRFYGRNDLEPTGPKLLSRLFNDYQKKQFSLYHTCPNVNMRYIFWNSRLILKCYDGYLNEFNATKITNHYSDHWRHRTVYK
jgi:mannosyltransferase OCH1-like enzyme